MANKKTKKKNAIAKNSSNTRPQKSFKDFNWNLAGKLLISFAVIFSVYQFCLKLAETNNSVWMQNLTLIIYSGATTVIAVIFIIKNRGVSNDIPTPEQLPDTWSTDEKTKFIEDLIKSKNSAKKLLIVLIPLILTLLIDMIYLFYIN